MLITKLIELYCLICHLYDTQIDVYHQRLSNFKPKFTDQELLTCYFFAMLNNQHHKREIYDYIVHHWLDWFPDLPSYQAFSNRLNNLSGSFASLATHLLQNKLLSPNDNFSADSLIDSFPVMLARGKNSKSCRTARDLASFGYCASKDIYYYGGRLHNLAIRRFKTLPLPTAVFISQASTHDLTAFKQSAPPVLTQNLFADKAYADHELQLLLGSKGVNLLTPPKKKKGDLPQFYEPLWSKFVSRFKQPIESFFKWLNDKTTYQDASRVRSNKGLLLHCYGKFAFACLLLCFYS